MHKFEYRAPRYGIDLAVRLIADGSNAAGRCREISRDGLCVQFPERLPVGLQGRLIIHYRDQSLEIHVRVAHTGANGEGLKFLFRSGAERSAVDELVAAIAECGPKPGPVLVR